MFLSLFIKGLFIGIGAILPGVSGGALAVILGIYEKMLSSINNFLKNPVKNFIFLFTVGTGALLGVVLFSNVQKFLLLHYETETLLMLTGLLIGTFPLLFKNANKQGFPKHVLSRLLCHCLYLLLFLLLNPVLFLKQIIIRQVFF